MRSQASQFLRRPSPTPTPSPDRQDSYVLRPTANNSLWHKVQEHSPPIGASALQRQLQHRGDISSSMNFGDASLQPQAGRGESQPWELRSDVRLQEQLHTAPPPLPVMPPAHMGPAQPELSPLFSPGRVESSGNFRDVSAYLPMDDSEDEAVEFDEPIDTLNHTNSPHCFKIKPRNKRSTTNLAYSKITADDNRSAALNRALGTQSSSSLFRASSTPESSLVQDFTLFLDEDPNDDDFEPRQTSGKRKQQTKTGRFAALYSDDDDEDEDEDDEVDTGLLKRKRNRYPLMANLEIDREKYDFRLPYYLSIRRSLRGRHWTRAPVKLGTAGYIINSPLIRPLRAESIPAKQFHDRVVKKKRISVNQLAKKKSHGEYISSYYSSSYLTSYV
jgi:hypothetical protein